MLYPSGYHRTDARWWFLLDVASLPIVGQQADGTDKQHGKATGLRNTYHAEPDAVVLEPRRAVAAEGGKQAARDS